MSEVLPHLLLALAAVIITGRVLAKLFAYVGQPPVIGEVVAGILLGPSLLGKELSAVIMPPSVAPYWACSGNWASFFTCSLSDWS